MIIMENNINDRSYEPMDIDLSSNSAKEIDISDNDSVNYKPDTKTEIASIPLETIDLTRGLKRPRSAQLVVKKYHIKIQKQTKSSKLLIFQVLSAVIVIVISMFIVHICSMKCCDDCNLDVLNENLLNKLLGQSEAVKILLKTLELNEQRKLVFFSGGTGVGKTLTSSILLDTLGTCSNVYHYTMPGFTTSFSTELMSGLIICKTSLIIVDDLTTNDMHIKTQLKEVIEKSENLQKNITIILIFNCRQSNNDFLEKCDSSIHKKLMENFAEIKAYKSFVEFKPLTETHLKECLMQELGNRKLSEEEFDVILKNFNVTIDGCKGVHSRMKYLNIV